MSKVPREVRLAKRRRALEAARGGSKKPDPSQNLHVEKGRPVTLDEVRAHALDGHVECRARPGLARDGRPCRCATRRFFRAHPEVIVDAAGNAWWPAKAAEAPGG